MTSGSKKVHQLHSGKYCCYKTSTYVKVLSYKNFKLNSNQIQHYPVNYDHVLQRKNCEEQQKENCSPCLSFIYTSQKGVFDCIYVYPGDGKRSGGADDQGQTSGGMWLVTIRNSSCCHSRYSIYLKCMIIKPQMKCTINQSYL